MIKGTAEATEHLFRCKVTAHLPRGGRGALVLRRERERERERESDLSHRRPVLVCKGGLVGFWCSLRQLRLQPGLVTRM